MINIPTTDIMTLITGDVDKAVMADSPQAAEISFLGVINAEGSGADEQADPLGFLMNPDMARSVEKPDYTATAAPVFANSPVQTQREAGQTVPVLALYNNDMYSFMQPALAKTTSASSGPEADLKSGEPESKLAVEMTGVQARKITSSPQTQPQSNTQSLQMNDAQPAYKMPMGKIESPRMAPLYPPGDTGIHPSAANAVLQQMPADRADGQAPISPIERFNPETVPFDETAPIQQVENAERSNSKTMEQVNQRPISRPINLGPVSAERTPSQRASNPQHPVPPPPELPVNHTVPDTLRSGTTTADRPLASQAEIPVAQHAPVPPPMNMTNQPIDPVLTQPDPQHANGASTLPPLRPQMPHQSSGFTLPPPAHPVVRGLKTIPESQLANAPTPYVAAQYGSASNTIAPKVSTLTPTQSPAAPKVVALETAKPPTLPKAIASDVTQPHSNPDASAPETSQPPAVLKVDAPKITQSDDATTLAAFKSRESSEAPKVATGDTNKTKAPTELAASKTTRPKPPAQTVVPEITGVDALKSLETPEFVPLEARSAEAAPFVRQDANLNRPEVMRHVAQQLTDAARQMPDRPVELALNPEELGRVRLTFTTTDAGLHVAVIAERGETMDLLRRHIESLAQDFRDLGYRDVKFDFSGNGARSDANTPGNENADQDQNANPDAASQDIDAPIQLSLEPSAGLDLRL